MLPRVTPRQRRTLERLLFVGVLLWLAIQVAELRRVLVLQSALLIQVLERSSEDAEGVTRAPSLRREVMDKEGQRGRGRTAL